MADRNDIGSIGWIDITVDDARGLRDFYARVTGWKPQPVSMGGYDDFTMTMPASGTPAAGICHARGSNAGLPRQWLIYIVVADVEESARACVEAGGRILAQPRPLAGGKFAVMEDPAGAVAALYQAP